VNRPEPSARQLLWLVLRLITGDATVADELIEPQLLSREAA
jgi:hypothetical protein